MTSLFRDRTQAHSGRVSFVELFFDLVFVFAITQLSHYLVHDYSLKGALETAFLTLAVWWAWIYTTWVTNWMNPESGPVRVMMFTIMGLGLLMITAIPKAFSDPLQGLVFAGSYVAFQLGRSVFMALCLRGHSHDNHLNFVRISIWLTFSGAFWIAGGLLSGEIRVGLWIAALLIDFISPRAFFWVPGLGRSHFTTWDIDGEHFAERCGLFIIIALGETIIVMGNSFSHHAPTFATSAAFVTAFLTCLSLWWLYFGITATKASHAIASAKLPGRLAQLAYTYVHVAHLCGIIVTAVGLEHVLQAPLEPAHLEAALSIVGGPALFLIANAIFIRLTSQRPVPVYVRGLDMLVLLSTALAFAHVQISHLILAAVCMAVLWIVGLVDPILYVRRLKAETTPPAH
jgi:low temperature requirement protein LtrA